MILGEIQGSSLFAALDRTPGHSHFAATSVFEKSFPLNRSGSRVALASA
jgi:hypothetical protein